VWSDGEGERSWGILVQSRTVDIPDVFGLVDTARRILVDSILGRDGQPAARIDDVSAISVDTYHIGGMEPYPVAIGIDPF
jgi:hypothetical protein